MAAYVRGPAFFPRLPTTDKWPPQSRPPPTLMIPSGGHQRRPDDCEDEDEQEECLVTNASTAIDRLAIKESQVHVGNKIVYKSKIVLPDNSGKIVFDVGGTTFKLFLGDSEIPRLIKKLTTGVDLRSNTSATLDHKPGSFNDGRFFHAFDFDD
ncbi:hypothetical protein AAG570_011725 [Ranatra chinensis]|uniref:Uncharacterized protein n=1 Tax=Ranatra chinensis TaxID=642074 RepID=A0ABD0YV63_9HEMI